MHSFVLNHHNCFFFFFFYFVRVHVLLGVRYTPAICAWAWSKRRAGQIGTVVDQLMPVVTNTTRRWAAIRRWFSIVRLGGAGDGAGIGGLDAVAAPARAGGSAPAGGRHQHRSGQKGQSMTFSILPEQASTLAADVDALYFFLIVVCRQLRGVDRNAGDRVLGEISAAAIPARSASRCGARWLRSAGPSRPSWWRW